MFLILINLLSKSRFIIKTYFENFIKILFFQLDVPGVPRDLKILEDGSRHLVLSWSTSDNSNAVITAYIITYTIVSTTNRPKNGKALNRLKTQKL